MDKCSEYIKSSIEDTDHEILLAKVQKTDIFDNLTCFLEKKDDTSDTTKDETWVTCVGIFESLLCDLNICTDLLNKIKSDTVPNPIAFLVESVDIISLFKTKATEYINYATNVLAKELPSEQPEPNLSTLPQDNIIDNLLDHDPGKRGKIESSSQRNYLLSLGPFQPKLVKFPINIDIFESKQRQFCSNWYKEYPYLEYSIFNDSAYCYICGLFPSGPNRSFADPVWSTTGIRHWHKMKSRGTKKPGKLEQHFTSNAHKAALSDYSNFVLHSNHIDNLLNKKHRENAINFSKQKEYHKAVIRILFDVSRTLARQGLAFRGDGDEKNGNFYQIVLLISRHNSTMKTWLNDSSFRRYHSTYLSHDSQNEFIHLLAKETKNNIIEEVKEAGMYSIMADTTPDLSHKDQLSVCLRYVNSKAEVCERLIAIDEIVDKTGKGIASKISDVLSQNSLDLNNIAFQSYDFASSMSGKNLGTQAMLSRIVGHNIPFIPCQAHRTNTFIEHSCSVSTTISHFFSVLESLYVFFTSSTKRYFYLNNKLLEVDTKLKLRNLSMTRWTARAESIKAVWVLFEYILDVLKELINDTNIDNKTRAQALGLEKKMLSFDFIVCIYLMKHIMYQMKVLTEQLETENLNIIDAILLIESCIKSLKEINEDESQINNIITSAEIFAKKLDVDSNADFNKFHRQRNLPKKIDCNSSTQVIFNLQTFYRKEFKEVLDTLINESANNLRDCFKIVEPIFKILSIPIKSDIRTEDIEKACGLFPPSYEASLVTDYDAILCQINILRHKTEHENTLEKVLNVSESLKTLVPVANSLCRLSFTAPVTTASNERSFSKLKIIKNQLRTIMAANRLDDLMILNSAKDIVDNLNLEDLIINWAALKERRIKI